jgi:hypothetical protein
MMCDLKMQPATLLSDYIVGFGQKTFLHLVVLLVSVALGPERERAAVQLGTELGFGHARTLQLLAQRHKDSSCDHQW